MFNLFHARTKQEIETRRRIVLSVAAWAYEYADPDREIESFLDDHTFDRECYFVDLSISTSRPDLDEWFRANFQPFTGSWVKGHPEKHKLEAMYFRSYRGKMYDASYSISGRRDDKRVGRWGDDRLC